MLGIDGLAARRQFVDDTHVEVAVDGHGEGAGDGGGGHHQYVGRVLALAPQSGTLLYAEAVLLVDDGEAQAQELHVVLDDGMCADEDVHAAVDKTIEHLLPPFSLHDAGEQFHADVHAAQEVGDGGEMLFGKNFGGRHHAHLVAVVDGDEGREEGHKRLARPHVALQQAVHLPATLHVAVNLAHHAFLGVGEGEGQVVVVEVVEMPAHAVEHISAVFAALVAGIAQDVELHVEQFLKLQPHLRMVEFGSILGVMDEAHGLIAGDEV